MSEEGDGYVMSFFSTLIPKRLHVGKFPHKPEDIAFLKREYDVDVIVNLVPHTDETTKSGKFNKASYYEAFIRDDTRILRVPLPAQDVKAENFLSAANAIFADWSGNRNKTYYVHHTTGCDEECVVAFLAWKLIDKATFPSNIGLWLQENEYERMLETAELKDALHTALITLNNGAFMNGWGLLNWFFMSGEEEQSQNSGSAASPASYPVEDCCGSQPIGEEEEEEEDMKLERHVVDEEEVEKKQKRKKKSKHNAGVKREKKGLNYATKLVKFTPDAQFTIDSAEDKLVVTIPTRDNKEYKVKYYPHPFDSLKSAMEEHKIQHILGCTSLAEEFSDLYWNIAYLCSGTCENKKELPDAIENALLENGISNGRRRRLRK